jgi:uncharacterized membrane protein
VSKNSTAGSPSVPAPVALSITVPTLLVLALAVTTSTWNALTVIPILVGVTALFVVAGRATFTRSQK